MQGKLYRVVIKVPSVDPHRQSLAWIPEGETIEISSFRPTHRRMVDLLWKGKMLVMFIEDIGRCCEEVVK
jgi:hypothetical protein